MRRLRSLGEKNREVPLISLGGQMDDFFARLQKRTKDGSKLPTWYVTARLLGATRVPTTDPAQTYRHGELYFELHRGTYTSHAPVKKGNRKKCVCFFSTWSVSP